MKIFDSILDKFGLYNWVEASRFNVLSEEFIEEHANELQWNYISKCQKLSEEFIENHFDKVNWENISRFQKLSEEFIEKHADKVIWNWVSVFQKLSEEFIEKHSDEIDWYYISKYQKLSPEFIEKHNLEIPDTCWLYKDKEFKRKYIQENTKYEIIGDKVIAYKSCRSDGYSIFNFRYKYEVGKEYTSHADFNIDNQNSFGLSAWTRDEALEYCSNGKLFKIEIDLDDIAAITNYNKIRAIKIKILEEINTKQ